MCNRHRSIIIRAEPTRSLFETLSKSNSIMLLSIVNYFCPLQLAMHYAGFESIQINF